MNDAGDDELLRRFEPILRYTMGEQFLPIDVEPYVDRCSLWRQRKGEVAREIIPHSELTLERLANVGAGNSNEVFFLKFTEPLDLPQMARYTLGARKEGFRVGASRLVRVGYASRLVDALFSFSLLLRGRVPGDAAAAAKLAHRTLREQQTGYVYHGRVVRQGNWVVLQYWFFYLFNDWRSSFGGANDHEADWEMACVYLAETPDGDYRPEWLAFASHDYQGDDLRRRWDDPEVQKIDEHPIIFVGAGSHASYFSPGEYLTEIELPFLRPFSFALSTLTGAWQSLQRRISSHEDEVQLEDVKRGPSLSIPFVDYARGDGLSIGPGQQHAWGAPHLLSPETPRWAEGFRGLWGLYANDPFAGEDAPAGPMYNRDGTVRQSWYDPVGWAGLNKVAPALRQIDLVRTQRERAQQVQTTKRAEIEVARKELHRLGIEATVTADKPFLKLVHQDQIATLERRTQALNTLYRELTEQQALIQALDDHERRLRNGEQGSPRAHIHRAHHPMSPESLRTNRLAEIWAAASVTLSLGAIGASLLLQERRLIPGILLWVVFTFTFIEAALRGTFTKLVNGIAVTLALVAAAILVYQFFFLILAVLVIGLALYVLVDNVREVSH